MIQQPGAKKSGASAKPPDPVCPMCGGQLSKSPLGNAALHHVAKAAQYGLSKKAPRGRSY